VTAVAAGSCGSAGPAEPGGGTSGTASGTSQAAASPAPDASGASGTPPSSGAPSGTPPSSGALPSSGASSRRSAYPQLAAFFTAAATADARLRAAAARVNGEIGPDTIRFSSSTVAAVEALDLSPVARAIPAGSGPGLLRLMVLVYSDLASRTWAFARVGATHYPSSRVPVDSREGKDILACLGNGAPAAARFAADVFALQALARASAPFTVAAASSRVTAERDLRIRHVDLGNSGCDACGGSIVTRLETITWHPRTVVPGFGAADGTIGPTAFRADYRPGSGWSIVLYAC
jgi:hypothetical protein